MLCCRYQLVFSSKDHEQADKFAVNIFGATGWTGSALAADEDDADQSALDVFRFVGVRVIEPHNRTGIVRAGAGALRAPPRCRCGSCPAARHSCHGAKCAVVIPGALGLLGIEDAVRDAWRTGGSRCS